MNKKIIGIFVCTLLITILIPMTTLSTEIKSKTSSNNPSGDDIYEQKLLEIQKGIKEKNANWTAGYTTVFGPNAEFEPCCGVIDEKTTRSENQSVDFQGPLPSEYDWRNVNGTNWMTSVKNQGGCGSCVAFATLSALEAVVQIEKRKTFDCDLSEAFLFYCGGGTCSGGWYFDKAASFVSSTGVPDELCFPYQAVDTPCAQHAQNWNTRIVKASNGQCGSPEDIKKAVVKYGPLLTNMDVYEDFQAYRGGIYEHVSGAYKAGHGATIVGYKDDKSIDTGGYWICKNSWGTGWGENGYFRIKYEECKIGDTTYYFDKVTGNIPPFAPTYPHPFDRETNVDLTVNLSWTPSQDLNGEKVYYTVYLNNDKIANKTVTPFIIVTGLKYSTVYSWKVIAEDERGSQSGGVKWAFGTRAPFKPIINGTNEGKIKTEYTYTALVPDTDSDGQQYYWFFDWGDKTNSGWLGPYNPSYEERATHSWTEKGDYTIKVIYKVDSASSDTATLPVTMPCSIIVSTPFMQFLQSHPSLFPILQKIFQR